MSAYRVTLPLPPSVNATLRVGRLRNGVSRLMKTKEAGAWRRVALSIIAADRPSPALRAGPLVLTVLAYVPTLASDGLNRLKALEDALVAAGVMDDDRQVVAWHVTKRIDAINPRVEVVLEQADPIQHPEVAKRLAVAEKRAAGKTNAPKPAARVVRPVRG